MTRSHQRYSTPIMAFVAVTLSAAVSFGGYGIWEFFESAVR